MDVSQVNPVIYSRYRSDLYVGDILLSRPSSFFGHAIAKETGKPYSHATMIGRTSDRLLMGESREGFGSRLIPLSREIEEWYGFYDVYRVRYRGLSQHFQPHIAWGFMVDATLSPYGNTHVTRAWLRRRISIVPPIPNSDSPQYPRDCSAQVQAALRIARGPVLKPYDCDVVPGDLSDPEAFRYVATLFWSQADIDDFKARRAAALLPANYAG